MSEAKPFASSADTAEKVATLNELAPGVFAYTAEGDPNVGAIVGEQSVVAIDARATPAAARDWLADLATVTDKPVSHLVLTHYHAVRALGASAFGANEVIASERTRALIAERGREDWESEQRRMPRLFKDPDEIPGLTWPTITFGDELRLWIDGREVQLRWLGRGHTAGDIVVWLPAERVLFAGDLVEAQAALYTGDAFVEDWRNTTLDAVLALGAEALVPGRGPAAVGKDAVAGAVAQTREFLNRLSNGVSAARAQGLSRRDVFRVVHEEMAPLFGDWPIFEHCLPFNVARMLDELDGRDPQIWTAESDAEIWAELQG